MEKIDDFPFMGVAVECQNMLDFTQPYPDRQISRHCDGQ